MNSYYTYYSSDDSKKRKRPNHPDDLIDDMAYSSTSSTMSLLPPTAPSRKLSQRIARPRDDVDEFLSSDLELSFASTVSLNSPPTSPPREQTVLHANSSPVPMDISPAPQHRSTLLFGDRLANKPTSRPRAYTVRAFGRELSNDASPSSHESSKSASSDHTASKNLQRAILPSEWLSSSKQSKVFTSSISVPDRPLSAPLSPTSPDAMDIDSVDSYLELADTYVPSSPIPVPAAPTAAGFSNLFFDAMSPQRPTVPATRLPKQRRSVSPVSSTHHEFGNDSPQTSSPAPPSSPSQRKLERFTSTGQGAAGGLFRKRSQPLMATLRDLSPPNTTNKRPRRPTISALIRPETSGSTHSAYPMLGPGDNRHETMDLHPSVPPARRAFSAMTTSAALGNVSFGDPSSDDTSFDGPEMSSPAAQALAKRQTVRTIRRRDGTDDFRPLTGAMAFRQQDPNMGEKESPSTKYMGAGLPGFGDNEAHGKILPCHRVTEDGLMRIDCKTLDALLDGAFDSQITEYHIIDCRFDYEYAGGHIPGAININTNADIEEFLLGPGSSKPSPSCSGDAVKKTVLVFHCEFSAKRAPTFAKHLRSKDRAMNNHVYPRILYPEVYILSGGYCQYYKESAARCQPRSYVTMDDPAYSNARQADMDQFRKARFGRTKSYAYGDNMSKGSTTQYQIPQQMQQRNSAPSGTATSLFAAASAARTRRGGGGAMSLSTLDEDGNTTSVTDDEGDSGLELSPCPPPSKGATLLKGKRTVRGPLMRSQTLGPLR